MELGRILGFAFVTLMLLNFNCVITQQTNFELPVQLIGFPAIVGTVRFTNFLKKLAYSLSPATYRSRSRRELAYAAQSVDPFDAQEVEKYIVAEFGNKACVFERICAHYATQARTQPRQQLDWSDVFRQQQMQARTQLKQKLDWSDVFRQYKRSQDQAKELYLLSVFLGDIVGSPQLCHQLGKRRPCEEKLLEGSS